MFKFKKNKDRSAGNSIQHENSGELHLDQEEAKKEKGESWYKKIIDNTKKEHKHKDKEIGTYNDSSTSKTKSNPKNLKRTNSGIDLEDQLKDAIKSISSLSTQIVNYEGRIQSLEKELQEEKHKNSDRLYDKDLKDKEDFINQKNVMLNEKEDLLKEKELDMAVREKKVNERERFLHKLEEKIKQEELEFRKKEGEKERLDDEILSIQNILEELNCEVQTKKEQLELWNNKIESKKEELSQLGKLMKERHDSLLLVKEDLKNKEKEYNEVEKEIEKKQQQLELLHGEACDKEEYIENVKKELEKEKITLVRRFDSLKKREHIVEERENLFLTTENEINELKESALQSKEQVKLLKMQVEELHHELTMKESVIEELENTYKTEVDALKHDLSEKEKEIVSLHRKCEYAMKDMKMELNKSQEEELERIQNDLLQKEKEIEQMKSAFENELKNKNKEIEEQRKEMKQYKEQYEEEQEKEKRKIEEDKKHRELLIEEQTQEIERLYVELAENQNQMVKLQNVHKMKEEELEEEVQKKKKEIEILQEHSQEKIRKLENQIKEMEEELKDVKLKHKEEVHDLNTKIIEKENNPELKNELFELRNTIESKEKEFEELKEQYEYAINNLKKEAKANEEMLEENLNHTRIKAHEQQQILKDQIEELEKSVHQKEEEAVVNKQESQLLKCICHRFDIEYNEKDLSIKEPSLILQHINQWIEQKEKNLRTLEETVQRMQEEQTNINKMNSSTSLNGSLEENNKIQIPNIAISEFHVKEKENESSIRNALRKEIEHLQEKNKKEKLQYENELAKTRKELEESKFIIEQLEKVQKNLKEKERSEKENQEPFLKPSSNMESKNESMNRDSNGEKIRSEGITKEVKEQKKKNKYGPLTFFISKSEIDEETNEVGSIQNNKKNIDEKDVIKKKELKNLKKENTELREELKELKKQKWEIEVQCNKLLENERKLVKVNEEQIEKHTEKIRVTDTYVEELKNKICTLTNEIMQLKNNKNEITHTKSLIFEPEEPKEEESIEEIKKTKEIELDEMRKEIDRITEDNMNLQNMIVQLKEELYVKKLEYESQIQENEEMLENLRKQIQRLEKEHNPNMLKKKEEEEKEYIQELIRLKEKYSELECKYEELKRRKGFVQGSTVFEKNEIGQKKNSKELPDRTFMVSQGSGASVGVKEKRIDKQESFTKNEHPLKKGKSSSKELCSEKESYEKEIEYLKKEINRISLLYSNELNDKNNYEVKMKNLDHQLKQLHSKEKESTDKIKMLTKKNEHLKIKNERLKEERKKLETPSANKSRSASNLKIKDAVPQHDETQMSEEDGIEESREDLKETATLRESLKNKYLPTKMKSSMIYNERDYRVMKIIDERKHVSSESIVGSYLYSKNVDTLYATTSKDLFESEKMKAAGACVVLCIVLEEITRILFLNETFIELFENIKNDKWKLMYIPEDIKLFLLKYFTFLNTVRNYVKGLQTKEKHYDTQTNHKCDQNWFLFQSYLKNCSHVKEELVHFVLHKNGTNNRSCKKEKMDINNKTSENPLTKTCMYKEPTKNRMTDILNFSKDEVRLQTISELRKELNFEKKSKRILNQDYQLLLFKYEENMKQLRKVKHSIRKLNALDTYPNLGLIDEESELQNEEVSSVNPASLVKEGRSYKIKMNKTKLKENEKEDEKGDNMYKNQNPMNGNNTHSYKGNEKNSTTINEGTVNTNIRNHVRTIPTSSSTYELRNNTNIYEENINNTNMKFVHRHPFYLKNFK